MKTTLNLDDDIAAFLQEQSRIHNKPLEQVVNETLPLNTSPAAMSLEAAYGSVEPANKPENFNEITAIARQAKAEETARKLNHA